MNTPAFDRFQRSFLDESADEYVRDRLDTDVLAALSGEERRRAEDLLFERLPEVRAVIGLGVLRSHRAESELVRHFEEERASVSWLLIALAQALWRIRPDLRWLDAEIDALQRAASVERRQGAAAALGDFRDPVAVGALIKALDDPEPSIRQTAASSLLMIHGQPVDLMNLQSPHYRVRSPDRAKRHAAKEEILATIAGLPLATT
jgi:hypothetical protein